MNVKYKERLEVGGASLAPGYQGTCVRQLMKMCQ